MAAKALIDVGAKVTLIEKASRLGGHAFTYEDELVGKVDLGFMVCNRPTYPNFFRVFEELGVEIVESDMSLSIFNNEKETSWSFQGGNFGWTIRNLWRPRLWKFAKSYASLTDRALPFLKKCQEGGKAADALREKTLAEVCDGLDEHFLHFWLYPMISAVWSAEEPTKAAAAPILAFLRNHQLLWPNCGSLKWLTPRHGSEDYVSRLAAQAHEKGMSVLTSTEVVDVDHQLQRVLLKSSGGASEWLAYDKLILAGHATDSQRFEGLHPSQKEWLRMFKTSDNDVALWAGDEAAAALMPTLQEDWACWNCPASDMPGPCRVTYWLSKLQVGARVGDSKECPTSVSLLLYPITPSFARVCRVYSMTKYL
jgi:predicted NAD/FAD-binding protein